MGAVAVSVIIYIGVMMKLSRDDKASSTKDHSHSFSISEATKKIKRSRKKERVVEQQTSYLSVNDQIELLTQKMLSSNSGAERRKLLDQIRELESQR